jgi:type VI protein secretion system component VasA
MKEYRLLAWPELPAEYQRTAHRRVLSDMSLRYLSLAQLSDLSVLKKGDLKNFLELLDLRGVLDERDGSAPDSFLDSIGRLGWLRRSTVTTHDER